MKIYVVEAYATEDIKYWNDHIFTVEDYERDSLITSVYEMHKDA